MAQLAPIAAVIGAGVSTYATVRQAQTQSAVAKQSAENGRAQEVARAQQAATEGVVDSRAREARLAGTIASARARLAAGGVSPDSGSAAALVAGLRRDAAAAQSDSEALSTARLSAGRRSLLNPDGSLTTWLRAGASFGNTMRSLLD